MISDIRVYAAELSKAVWDLKDGNIQLRIKWSITDKAPAYKSSSSKCNLSLTEKLAILKSSNLCLNKHSELIAKCCQCNKFKLKKLQMKFQCFYVPYLLTLYFLL